MKVSLLAVGTRGDTQPCAALGVRLRERGHEVSIVAPHNYESLIVDAGLEYRPLEFDPAKIVQSEVGQELLSSGPAGFVKNFRKVVGPIAGQIMQDCAAGSADADVIVASPAGGLGRHISEHLGVPQVLMHFQPSEPTGAFANPLLRGRDLGRTANRASYRALERITGLALRTVLNDARHRILGLPPLTGDTFGLDRQEGIPVLCGASPLVVPRPLDWPAHVHLTGAWTMPPSGHLGADLEAFLDAGPAPVWVGFGSMESDDPDALGGTVVAAARAAGMRVVVQGLPVTDVMRGDDVHIVGETEHVTAFPRMAAIVHHGGAGTTAAALGAGVPSVVCPFFGDQPYWADRVAAIGVGPAPLPQKKLSASRLSRAIWQATHDEEMARRARGLGQALAREDGAALAAALIEERVAGIPARRFRPRSAPVTKAGTPKPEPRASDEPAPHKRAA
ncbi:MAG: glycosyltransferase [Solirubrobacteraceae bacterium]|nr:glycosyltransferase [Solirubrobacteraceae bacterium]